MTSARSAHDTGKAAIVLAAAEELILKQGFKGVTMAAVAQRAHVGKGTPYPYWRTKEDLFLELIVRNLADSLLALAGEVRADPGLAAPEQLCPQIAVAWLDRPLVRAVQASDADVLGGLVDDARARTLVVENGAAVLLRRLLPVWAEHGLIRDDWSLQEQADVLELLLLGYFHGRTHPFGHLDAARIQRALRRSVAATLRTSPLERSEAATAEQVGAVLEDHAQRLRRIVD